MKRENLVADEWYIDSGAGGGNGDGQSLVNASLTIAASFALGAAGDDFFIKDDHNEIFSSNTKLTCPGTTTLPCRLISISDTDVYGEAASAQLTTTVASVDITLDGCCYCFGIYIAVGDSLDNRDYVWTFDGGTIEFLRELSEIIGGGRDDYHIEEVYKNLEIKTSTGSFSVFQSWVGAGPGLTDNVTYTGFTNKKLHTNAPVGGAVIRHKNSDLSMFNEILGSDNESGAKFELTRCILHADCVLNTFPDGISQGSGYIKMTSCDTGSGYHYFYTENYYGKAFESETIYRDDGDTYDPDDSASNFSTEFQPNSNVVEFSNPLSVRICTKKLNLNTGAKSLRFFMMQQGSGTPADLTDKNCILRAIHPDTADTALGVEVRSFASGAAKDILDAGVDYTNNSEAWTGIDGGADQTYQQIDITIPGNTEAGMDNAVVEFWLDLSIDLDTPSIEFFIDTLPDTL